MKYILEIFYQGKSLERREYNELIMQPIIGDTLYIEFENPRYSQEYGYYWIVRDKKHLLFNKRIKTQTLQLLCEPCDYPEWG